MIKIRVYLDHCELQKIIAGLLVLRQKHVDLNHITIFDKSNVVNKPIIVEIEKIDKLTEKLLEYYGKIENGSITFPTE